MIEKEMKQEVVNFYNWWPYADIKEEWFYRFLHHRGLVNPANPITFFSVFGERAGLQNYIKKEKEITVFFTGETVWNREFNIYQEYQDYCLNDVDLSLGFDIQDAKNYFRFPLWICYLVKPEWSFQDLKNNLEKINDPKFRLNGYRDRFICQISRHDVNGVRTSFINLLNQIDAVTCAGRFANNTDELVRVYRDNKIEYLKNFKFNLCPENFSVDYYVTEKIFESIMAGCIPIYWGNGYQLAVEPEVLNQNAILRCFVKQDVDTLYQNIERLHRNPKAFEEFAQIKPFTDNAAEAIWAHVTELEMRIKALMK